MKLLFASDIHGCKKACENIVNAFYKEKADMMIFCGDILYHGPRNDLPINYAPKAVISILNELSDKIICVRGNCEAEVDQMVLGFPVLADYSMLYVDNIKMYITHGHIFNDNNPLKLQKNDVLISGHTHILKIDNEKGYLHLNPGSAALAKESNPNTYMIYENLEFIIKDFDNNIIKKHKINREEM